MILDQILDNVGYWLPLAALVTGTLLGAAAVALLWRYKVHEARELARYHSAQEFAGRIAALEQEVAGLSRELESERAHVRQQQVDKSSLRDELEKQREQYHHLKTRQAVGEEQFRQEKRHFEQQLQLLTEARVQLTKEFENLAHKIFEQKQAQFTQHSKEALDVTLDPVKRQLQEFRKKVEDVYEKENAERNKLVGQITELQKQTRQIGEDAVNLANALKGDNKAQGNWGEVVLERLLEESGLQKGREYETQVSLKGSDGQRRSPDVIIRLPENKDIIIDAKVSLLDYDRYCSSDSDEERQQALKQHIASLRTHIGNLSIKDYEKLEQVRTLDFVFIFVPVEAAFMLALQHEPTLFREAYDKHIILVSPTTLLATLRTVEGIWRYEKQNKNAEKIARQAGALHDQFVLLIEALEDVGRNIRKTQQAYDTVQKRLVSGRGNLVKRVGDIKLLGAKTKKALDPALLEDAGQAAALELDDNEAPVADELPASELDE